MKKTTIFFESLQRLSKSLLSIEKTFGPKQIIWIGSELTKLFEKKRKGSVTDIYEFVSENEREKKNWKGEIIVIIAPYTRKYNLDISEESENLNSKNASNPEISSSDFL
jgi:16S rRNA C1402 (ribose-2'-O) methylase RsmI